MTVRRMNWYEDEGYVGDEFIDCHMGEVFWASSYSVALCVRLNYVDPTQWSSLFSLALPAGGEPRLSVEIKPDRVVDFLLNGVECLCPSLPVPEDEWVIIAVTDNGAVAPRLHLYRFETDTWAHASFDTKPPWASPALLENGRVRFGHFDHNDWATVDFDRAAFYHYAHSDTNIEKLSKTPNWNSTDVVVAPIPICCWVLGDAPLVDRMGHGADEVESNGTELLYEFGPYTDSGPVRVKTSHGWLDLGGGGEPGPVGPPGPTGPMGPPSSVNFDAWQTVTLATGWTHYGGVYGNVQFRKTPDGRVELRGIARWNTGATGTICTLPVGYRPSQDIVLNGALGAGTTPGQISVYVTTAGVVTTSAPLAAGTWVSLADVNFATDQAGFPTGPQGAKGDKGDPGPQGTFLGIQEDHSVENVYSANVTATGHTIRKDAAGGVLMRIGILPPVDAWWEVVGFIGTVQKMDAAYHYSSLALTIDPGPEDQPSGPNVNVTSDNKTQHSTVQTFEPRRASRTVQLKAGVQYYAFLTLYINGGTWRYARSQAGLWIEGKAWAR